MMKFVSVFLVATVLVFVAQSAIRVAYAENAPDEPSAEPEATDEPAPDPISAAPGLAQAESNIKIQRESLEKELAELEKQIAEEEALVAKYRSEGSTLKNEIKYLDSRITQINLQIKSINLTLAKVNQNITETQKSINTTEDKIDIHRDALEQAIRAIYESERRGLADILLTNKELSDFFNAVNEISLVQNNLRAALQSIVVLRQELIEQKLELAAEKEDQENLKSAQENQRSTAASTQKTKQELLKVTKGKETEYQKVLSETRQTAAQIRSRIFTLLGGGELTFQKAYEFAKVAEQATGIRAPFLLAILNQESNFGRNVGQCKYDKIIPQTGSTVMNPKQIPIFLGILGELGISPDSIAALVSCPILRDGSYGGAMGPAQFIPSTWNIYRDDVAKITGSNPPSPWNNADAFTATALYLKDSINSASCQNYSQQIPSQKETLLERCAASQYYAGSRWHTYRWVYGEPVVTKANQFARDIEILEG